MSENQTLPELQSCDPIIRARAVQAVAEGLSKSELARGANVDKTIVIQYLNERGNIYPGNISQYELRISNYLDGRDLQFMAGIKTVCTGVTTKIQTLAKCVRRQRIMGKGIGCAGIGKTRGATFIQSKDQSFIVTYASKQTGTLEAIRSKLFNHFGVRGGKKTYGATKLDKYLELVKRVRAADVVFIFDQAHRLSSPAMHFLCELWNDTKRGQLWLGTEALLDKLERDEQIASRVEFGDVLKPDADISREVIQHQIKSILPEVNGELSALTKLCASLAGDGHFRRVEMRLGEILYLSQAPSNRDKTWCDLFEDAEAKRREAFPTKTKKK